jgi:hypothetical protein
MPRALPCCALLLALVAAAPAPAAAKVSEQTLIVRVAALDTLIADAKYLAELAGEEERAKQAEAYLKSLAGDKGLEGLDTTRPMGAYGKLKENFLDSEIVLMLPIADEKAFLALLKKVDVETAADAKTGVYKVTRKPLPAPVFFRFANGYLYATLANQVVLDKDKLIAPDDLLKRSEVGTASVTVNLDAIPDDYRVLARGAVGRTLGALKDRKLPGEPDSVKAFRAGLLDELGDYVRSAFNDGGPATLRLDIDRKAGELGLTVSFAAKEKSKLAAAIADLEKVKGVGAGLVTTDSAAHVIVNAGLSDKLRKLLRPVIADAEKALERIDDKEDRERVKKLFQTLVPTARSAALDLGLTLNGPGAGKHYTGLAVVAVKDGAEIEKAVRELVKGLPEKERDRIKLDADKAGSFNIHRIQPEREDENAKRVLGNNTVFLAVRGDAVFVAVGEKAVAALKEAVAREPKSGRAFEAGLSVARLAPILDREVKGASDIAAKVFGEKKDGDKIVVTLDGGKSLRLRIGMKAQLVKFFAQLQEARDNGK